MKTLVRTLILVLLPGVAAADKVELIRDDWGVPHIYAETERAAFYALGVATAEDRAERFFGTMLWARGELSAVLGPGYLSSDRINRRWQHRALGIEAAQRLREPLHTNYQAFIDGFNDWVAEHRPDLHATGVVPAVADLITLVRGSFYFFYSAAEARAECGVDGLRFNDDMMVVPAAAEPGQSNGWAVAPRNTAAGGTILLADPHVETNSPAYYEYRLHAGELHSAGFALGPVLWQAHNRDLTWSFTTGAPDVADCYAVQTDPDNPRRYRYDGEWREFELRRETISVAGGKSEEHEFEYSRHNGVLSPVLDRRDGVAYVASVPAMHRDHLMHEELDLMNRARSVAEVRRALRSVAMFPQNLIVADRAGSLWYLRAGTAARRPAGYDWKAPVPGNSSETAWKGLRKLRELVQIHNPKQGFLQNNNTAPDTMFDPSPIDANDWAVDAFNDRPGRITSRAVRAHQVLDQNRALSLEQALDLAMDEKWSTWESWLSALRYAIRIVPEAEHSREPGYPALVKRLLDFDGHARHGSKAAAAFYVWQQGLNGVLAKAEHAALREWPMPESAFTPAFARDILAELARAAVRLREARGSIDVTLGDLIRGGKTDPGVPLGGITIDDPSQLVCVSRIRPQCDRTLRAFGVADPLSLKPQKVLRGSQAMRLVQFTTPMRSLSLYAFGQSDDPASPHFEDQAILFQQRRMKPTYFDRAHLEIHIESRRVLDVPAAEPTSAAPRATIVRRRRQRL